jgi:hypothetical protein
VSAGIVEIPGDGDAGDPFIVGDELTIFEAAMVYCGRDPGGLARFIEDPSLSDHESFVGRNVLPRRNFDERPYKISWAVWRDLYEMMDRREIEPVRTYYSSDGKLDPLTTVIRTVDLANLAKKRGDASFDFSPWMPGPTSDAPPPRTERARPRPKRDRARALILAKFSDGPPADMSLCELMRKCGVRGETYRRTFARARNALRAEKDCRAGA